MNNFYSSDDNNNGDDEILGFARKKIKRINYNWLLVLIILNLKII